MLLTHTRKLPEKPPKLPQKISVLLSDKCPIIGSFLRFVKVPKTAFHAKNAQISPYNREVLREYEKTAILGRKSPLPRNLFLRAILDKNSDAESPWQAENPWYTRGELFLNRLTLVNTNDRKTAGNKAGEQMSPGTSNVGTASVRASEPYQPSLNEKYLYTLEILP